MEKQPIENLMSTTMENIRDMVDVNTVIGDPVQTQDGSTIIPISRVAFGFVAGGGEYAVSGAQTGAYGMPFAGGAGAGVSPPCDPPPPEAVQALSDGGAAQSYPPSMGTAARSR